MPDAASAKYPLLISRERCGNAVRDFLRNHVGQDRRLSAQTLSEGTGIPKRRIECAMCDPVTQHCDFRPLAPEHLASLAKYFGPDFTNAWLGLADQVAIKADALDPADFARACTAYLSAYTDARDPASECGVDLGPNEQVQLKGLRAVAGVK